MKSLPNLWAYYPTLEVEGTTIKNHAPASKGTRNGTLVNGPTPGLSGKVGRALGFDGNNDHVTLGTEDPSSTDLTIMGILKWNGSPNTANKTQHIISKRDSFGASTMRWGFGLDKTNGYKYLIYGNGGAFPFWNRVPPVGTPEYFGLVHDTVNNVDRLYINGLQHSTVSIVTFGTGTTATIRIGAVGDSGGDEFLYASLQHLAILPVALSAAKMRKAADIAGFI